MLPLPFNPFPLLSSSVPYLMPNPSRTPPPSLPQLEHNARISHRQFHHDIVYCLSVSKVVSAGVDLCDGREQEKKLGIEREEKTEDREWRKGE